MKKLTLRLDLTKIDKTKITDRTYQKQDGTSVTEKNYNFELVPLKEEKVVKTTDKYVLVKVAMLADKSIKGADGKYINGTVLGDALEFRNVEEVKPNVVPSGYNGEIEVDYSPF